MNKVSLDFSTNQYPDPELKVKATTIAGNLERNAFFLDLVDNVTDIKTKIVTFDNFLAKMEAGNKQVTAEKNIARADLVDSLCVTGRLVQNISKGDEVMILSSGYDMNHKKAPVDLLDQPANVTVKAGRILGTLDVAWDVVDHARSYEVRYTQIPKTENNIYEKVTTPKRKITLEGLIQGQQYAIQVAGVGSDPRRVWSFEFISFVM